MYRRTFISALASSCAVLGQSGAATAAITIDPSRELGRLDPRIYGHFLEHLERVIYGGVYEPGSRFADEQGLRSDVIRAIQDMGGARILRWPGGNFASYYRWKDGIGPREKRPRRFDVVWRNYESNHFGTDEYLALCRKLNCEPFITVNMGNGGLEEACEWVEYCRRDKRQPAVRVWGLGNETYGPWQVGHSSAAEYARKAKQFGQFMRAVEPDLQYVGVGHKDEAWNDAVLKGCGSLLDWLSIHLYAHRHFLDGEDDYDSTVAAPAVFERSMRNMADQIAEWERTSPRQKPLQICLEEWNVRHFKKGAQNAVNPGLWRESPRNIVDALCVAGVFNVCQRLSARVTMTNYVFIVNAHGPLLVQPDGLTKSVLFDVYKLYATRQQPVAVQAEVRCEQMTTQVREAVATDKTVTGLLDVSATRSVDGRKLTLAMVNRYRTQPCRVSIDARGKRFAPGAVLHTVYHPDLLASNSRAEPDKLRASKPSSLATLDTVELPPHSVNLLELTIA